MPLKSAAGKGKTAIQKAVSANIHELAHAKKKRPMKQIIAIAESAARGGEKRTGIRRRKY